MEDRSTLLKIYNDRTTLLSKSSLTLKQFLDYLDQRALCLSKPILSSIATYSSVSNSIRPELLIEGILQYLKGKRDYSQESSFLYSMFQEKDSWSFNDFQKSFTQSFDAIYDSNEVYRVLQLVKRFGLDSDELVPYEYLSKLVATSKLKNYDIVRNCKKLFDLTKQTVLRIVLLKISSTAPNFYRKPLEIISNTSFSLSRTRDPKKEGKNSQNLRNKLFWQACRSFAGCYIRKIKFEAFLMIKDPYKFRDPYIHRAVFKMYLRIRNKTFELLSKTLMKWSNLPELYFDCIKDCSGTMGYTRENTVGMSKQFSILTLTHEFREKNNKVLGIVLEKALRSSIKRAQSQFTDYLLRISPKKLKILKKVLNSAYTQATRQAFSYFCLNSILKSFQSSLEKKQIYQTKRQKYTLTNKGKKLAARSIQKLLNSRILKKFFLKFRTNTRFPQRKLNRSFGKTVQIDLPKKPQGLSRSFVATPTSTSPRITTKYEEMKNSVKKIKIHHGFEKIWIVSRKIQKRLQEFPTFKFFSMWRRLLSQKSLNINLQKIKSTRSHHASQFSFRDKT